MSDVHTIRGVPLDRCDIPTLQREAEIFRRIAAETKATPEQRKRLKAIEWEINKRAWRASNR